MKKKHNSTLYPITILGILFSIGCFQIAYAQKLIPTVILNLEKTPDAIKPLWDGAERSISNFLTKPEWHENPYEYDVPFQVTIYIEQVIEKQPERTFKCYLVATNGAEAFFTDKRWLFPLPVWNQFYRDGKYHPMSAVLEFYANLILANEFDKWDLYGGELYYTKARAVGEQGKFDSRYILGWDERNGLLQHLTSRQRRTYRSFLHYAATSDYLIQYNPKEARGFADSAFILLPKLQTEDQKLYLSANALGMAKVAKSIGRRDYLELLMKVDSTHSSLYEDHLRKMSE